MTMRTSARPQRTPSRTTSTTEAGSDGGTTALGVGVIGAEYGLDTLRMGPLALGANTCTSPSESGIGETETIRQTSVP